MLGLSKNQRYFILSILFLGCLLIIASYRQKITLSDDKIDKFIIEEKGLLDLNRATAGELERLPGIGPMLAEGIINYRNTAGRFKDASEIKNVKGIGDKKFERIKALIFVSE